MIVETIRAWLDAGGFIQTDRERWTLIKRPRCVRKRKIPERKIPERKTGKYEEEVALVMVMAVAVAVAFALFCMAVGFTL